MTPTNDPTAPRVVGGGDEMFTSDAGCYHGANMLSLCYGQNHRPMQRVPTWIRRPSVIPAPAVLPEEALTKFTPEMEAWNGCDYSVPIPHSPWNLRCVQGRGHQGAHLLPANPYAPSSVSASSGAGSLRETGAGRGEADHEAELRRVHEAIDAVFVDAQIKAGPADERVKRALGSMAVKVHQAMHEVWERRLAASPEGGAPTEELTEEEGHVLDSLIDDAMTGHVSAIDVSEREELNALRNKLRRLTRSPRAAGEPSHACGARGFGLAHGDVCPACTSTTTPEKHDA